MKDKKEQKSFIYTKPGVIVLTIITAILIAGAIVAMDFGFGFGWFF
ncbi:MAG: hypothetical protein IJZ42_07390 [Lachnospiraceae bacterium]|nr:hypothetical protein [Lachnospiraceae bacterium]